MAHEVARAQRMADVSEGHVADPLMQGAPTMVHLTIAVVSLMAPAALCLDAVYVRAPFDAKNNPAVMPGPVCSGELRKPPLGVFKTNRRLVENWSGRWDSNPRPQP